MKKPTFPKFIRELVQRGQHGYCALCTNYITDYHHKLFNTESNRKLFPIFINSIFNCAGLCRGCHDNMTWKFRVSHDMALAYEEWLREMK